MKSSFRVANVKKRFRFKNKKKHRMKCAKCGKECNVPFVPKMDKPVYCNTCFTRIKRGKRITKLK